MTSIKNFKFAACLAVLAFAYAVAAQTPKPVRTQAGIVQGTMEGDVAVYKGIPFAAPPWAICAGARRSRPPRGKACMQPTNSLRRACRFLS